MADDIYQVQIRLRARPQAPFRPITYGGDYNAIDEAEARAKRLSKNMEYQIVQRTVTETVVSTGRGEF